MLTTSTDEIHKHRANSEWISQRKKCSNRQRALTEVLPIEEGLERFQHENKVDEAQDTLPIDPALFAVGPRVRGPPPHSVLIVILRDIVELDDLIH